MNPLASALRKNFKEDWLSALDALLRRASAYSRCAAPPEEYPTTGEFEALWHLLKAATALREVEETWLPLGWTPRDLAPLPPGVIHRLYWTAIAFADGKENAALLDAAWAYAREFPHE